MIKKTAILICLTIAGAVLAAGITGCGSKDSDSGQVRKAEQLKAALTFVKGKVLVERNGTQVPAEVNSFLRASDTLITGKDAAAEVLMKGFGGIKLGPDTRVTLVSLVRDSSVEVKLQKGNLASMINRRKKSSSYSVTTPTAIAGVRGTVFLTSVETLPGQKNPRVKVAVVSGKVAVSLPGQQEVILSPNTQMEIDGFQKITRDMVRGLSPKSLTTIKGLAVFHKSNVGEFNTLVEDLKSGSREIAALEGGDINVAAEERSRKTASRSLSRDTVAAARRVKEENHIKRDVDEERIKLKPNSTYK